MQSKRSFGCQICPECLRTDTEPYLRAEWRLSFMTICRVHRVSLIDRCPKCQAPIQPVYLGPESDRIDTCWHCGNLMSDTKSDMICDDRVLRREIRYNQNIGDHWCEMGEYGPIHVFLYFTILWRVYRLVATGRFAIPLRTEVLKVVQGVGVPNSVATVKEIEWHNPRCRRWLLQISDHLLGKWPHRFVRACQEVGVASRHLLKDRSKVPFALLDPIDKHLNSKSREFSAQELKQAKAYLAKRRQKPTRKNIQALIGQKFTSLDDFVEPTGPRIPYGSHRYWKLDGISPEVREMAKRISKLEGENVGPWVEGVLKRELARKERKYYI